MAARGIYLIGFSGTGKSTIAQIVSAELSWPMVDLDRVIVESSGMTIPAIFEREGETGFRLRETEALRAVSGAAPFVVATGGGAVVRVENRRLMARQGWIIALEGRPEVLNARIQKHRQETAPDAIRPLLDAEYPLDRIRALKYSRQSVYALADWTVHTDRLSPQQVAAEVVRAVKLLETTADPPALFDVPAIPLRLASDPDRPPPVTVAVDPWPYQVMVGWDHLASAGESIRRLFPRSHNAAVLTDAGTWAYLGDRLQQSLRSAGLEVHLRQLESDERVKTLAEAGAIYDWLLDRRVWRDDLLVVVGGVAIDDLGSFAASTYLQGIPLVKLPTTLEGMIDTSIGGKNVLSHSRARNLIGTVYHPRLVWSDVSLLRHQAPRERRAAFAEMVKYAMLESSIIPPETLSTTLLEQLDRNADQLQALDRLTLTQIVTQCVVLKAQVVSADEYNLGQYRMLLNYGHTIGHALEIATDYSLLHGEAVAIGMAVEARLAVRLGLADAGVETLQNQLLERLGLSTRLPAIVHQHLLELVQSDKAVLGDVQRWILPTSAGRAVVSGKVPEQEVVAALRECQ